MAFYLEERHMSAHRSDAAMKSNICLDTCFKTHMAFQDHLRLLRLSRLKNVQRIRMPDMAAVTVMHGLAKKGRQPEKRLPPPLPCKSYLATEGSTAPAYLARMILATSGLTSTSYKA